MNFGVDDEPMDVQGLEGRCLGQDCLEMEVGFDAGHLHDLQNSFVIFT